MSRPALSIQGISKCYRIGSRERRHDTAVGAAIDLLKRPVRNYRRLRGLTALHDGLGNDVIWALRDVAFDVAPGEVVGVIGHNGAGKSTLLKVLSRITEPTSGRARVEGRLASLLEVGTGFHPELTGRENVYLNGAMLGMKKAEIDRKLDEIVAFSGVETFLDTPTKRYSTGMYLRLAFSVAAHLEAEVLLLDEVLAVGDVPFQRKCLGKMDQVAKSGRTVLFVSHNMAAVSSLCSRAVVLDGGRLAFDGEPHDAIRRYLGPSDDGRGTLDPSGRKSEPERVSIVDAWIERNGARTASLIHGERASVFVEVAVIEPTRVALELLLRQMDGIPVAFCPSGLGRGWEVELEPGVATIRADLPPAVYAAGPYSLDLILADSGARFYDYVVSGIRFDVDSAAIGPRNWSFSQKRGQGFQWWDVDFSLVEP